MESSTYQAIGVRELLESEKSWLAVQPGMSPWANALQLIETRLEDWAQGHAGELGVEPPHLSDMVTCSKMRLWHCWSHHWKQAIVAAGNSPVSGEFVAEQIRLGQGFIGRRQLGGNPLRDVVLAQAVGLKLDQPTALFIHEYRTDLTKIASRIRPQLRNDDSWWGDLMDHLAGYTRPRGKLLSYQGKCALRNFLPRVLGNFIYDMPRSPGQQTEQFDEPPSQGNNPSMGLEQSECASLLSNRLQYAVAELPEEQRLLLTLRYEQNLEGKAIAGMLGIHPGNVSRRLQMATGSLYERIMNVETDVRQRVLQCLEVLDSAVVSSALANELMQGLNLARQHN